VSVGFGGRCSAVGAGAPSGDSATFLGFFEGRGNITAMLVVVKVHEVGVRLFNSLFIIIFFNVFHLFFNEVVEEPWSKGGGGDFDAFNGATRRVAG
jgi:hypothetical protein